MDKTTLDTPLPLTVSEASGRKRAKIVRAATRMAVERVVDGQREFLFVNHPTKGWELPGGAIDPEETGIAGAVREFREETGLSIDKEVNITLVATIPVDAGEAGFWLDLAYHALVNDESLKRVGEPEFELRWMTVDDLREATADKYVQLIGDIMR